MSRVFIFICNNNSQQIIKSRNEIKKSLLLLIIPTKCNKNNINLHQILQPLYSISTQGWFPRVMSREELPPWQLVVAFTGVHLVRDGCDNVVDLSDR